MTSCRKFAFLIFALLPQLAHAVCTPTSATLVFAGDDNLSFNLNGSPLTSCGACWASANTYNFSAANLASLNSAGDNVLSAYGTDIGGSVSGASWQLTINYSSCPTQVIQSDGACTVQISAGNAVSGSPPVTFPPGWTTVAYVDSAWNGPYASTNHTLSWMMNWVTLPGNLPWIWGTNSFFIVNKGDGFLFRQHFQLGSPACPITVPPTPTPWFTFSPSPSKSPTITYSPTPYPPACGPPSLISSQNLSVVAPLNNCYVAGANSVTYSNPGGPNALLVISIENSSNIAPTAISYAGVPLTLVRSDGVYGGGLLGTWILTAPPTGSFTLTITMPSSSCSWNVAAMFYNGVNQASPIGATNFANNTSCPINFSDSLTTVGNSSLIQDFLVLNGSAPPVTPGVGQTLMNVSGNCCNPVTGYILSAAAPGPYTMTYAFSGYCVNVSNQSLEIRGGTACGSPTNTPSNTRTSSYTSTPSVTLTRSPTLTPTPSFSVTLTATTTASRTVTPTSSFTYSATPSSTPTFSHTRSVTPGSTPTITLTSTPSVTFSSTPSATLSFTPTGTLTETPTFTVSSTLTPSATATLSSTPTLTSSPTSSATDSPTTSPTFTESFSYTVSPTLSPTPTVTMSKTPSAPFSASIRIFNSAGEEVAQLDAGSGFYSLPLGLKQVLPNFAPDLGQQGSVLVLGPNSNISWDGRNSAGQLVSSGTYYLMLAIKDSFGKTTSLQSMLTVLRTEIQLDVSVYNSAGELVKKFDVSGSLGSGAQLNLDRDSFSPKASGGLQIRYGDSPGDTVAWDGRDSQGRLLSSGTYTVRVSRGGGVGQGAVILSKNVTLLTAPSPKLFSGAWAGPSPLRSGDGPMQICLAPPGGAWPAGTLAQVDIYNLAGERVISLNNSGGASKINWSPARELSGGIYLLALNALDSSGRQQRGTIKVVLVR